MSDSIIDSLKNKVIEGNLITKEEAKELLSAPIDELCAAANEIREHFCGNGFDLCSITNAKCGKCSEDCKFCAQSAHYDTEVTYYSLKSGDEMTEEAVHNENQRILRFSLVTSGRSLSPKEIDSVCDNIREIKSKSMIEICVSIGITDVDSFRKLIDAGATRVHCNLETSARFFPSICSTHTYEDKIGTLKAARAAGLSICSGGIMGIGETENDRIDMAFTLRDLGVKSVPVNFLSPIKGTPLEHNRSLCDNDKRRIIAIYRFILPDAAIRLAGGRGLIADKGEGCFRAGANAAISGDMLTTSGITAATDIALIRSLGFVPKLSGQ